MEKLRQESELINFIRPADWMTFAAPKGINFRSLRDSSGAPIRDSIDKLETLHEFRTHELLATINEQYSGVSLEASNKLKVNSVVLLKHIDTVAKREPLRLARVNEIHPSRDGSQRIIAVTYTNVHQYKKGQWIGNQVKVKRQVSDVILVDNALDEVILGPDTKRNPERNSPDENARESITDTTTTRATIGPTIGTEASDTTPPL